MSRPLKGWKVKGSSEISHFYPDLRELIGSVEALCNQIWAFPEELAGERDDTRRCNLCEAKESSTNALAIIRKAWDTSD